MKLDFREKEEKKVEKEDVEEESDKSMSLNIDFEIVNGYLDRLKEHNEKQEAILEQSKKEDEIYISDLDPNSN